MSCDQEESLTAYLDGELSPARMEEMARHLSSCPHCPKVLELLQGSMKAVSSLPRFSPSADVRRNVLNRIDEPEGLWAKLSAAFGPKVLVPAGAIALGLLAFGIYFGQRERLPSASEAPDVGQLEVAQNLELIDDIDVVGLEQPDDVEVIDHLQELEAKP